MNLSLKALIVSLALTATAFAESPVALGAWSVTTVNGNHVSNRTVMLQTTAQAADGEQAGNPAKLDVICRNGKLSAIALEPAAQISKGAISFDGAVATTRVALMSSDATQQFGNWAVTDGGRTLTPYSEALQGKLTSRLIEQLARTQTVSFRVQASERSAQNTFATARLSEALFSVGCSY